MIAVSACEIFIFYLLFIIEVFAGSPVHSLVNVYVRFAAGWLLMDVSSRSRGNMCFWGAPKLANVAKFHYLAQRFATQEARQRK